MTFPGSPVLERRDVLAAMAISAVLLALPTPLRAAPGPVVEPEQFDRFGDLSGDAAPAIAAALDALVAAGGGTLRFRSGRDYRLAEIQPSSTATHVALRASIALPAQARNIVFDLNGATLWQDSEAFSFGTGYRHFNDRAVADTAAPLREPARRGDTSIRIANAGRFRPGMIGMLVAGDTDPSNAYAPIAEFVVVSRVRGNTVWLDRPLRKDYRSHGNYPFGLIDASAICSQNIAVVGPGRIVNRRRRTGNFGQILGFEMTGITCEGRGGMCVRGRDLAIRNCTSLIQANWSAPVYRPYAFAFDTGTSDASITDCRASGGDNMTYLHLHEALANITVTGLRIESGTRFDPHGESPDAISIRGGSWNMTVRDVQVTNNPQGGGLCVRESPVAGIGNRDLELANISLEGRFRNVPAVIVDRNPVRIDRCDVRNASARAAKPRARLVGPHVVSGSLGFDADA